MQTSSCLAGPFGATHRHEDEWGSVSAWENIGGTQMPTNPLSRPLSTPSWKYRETFFSRWQHKQLFQGKFQQRRLSLETIGSLMGQSPFQQGAPNPAEHNGTKVWKLDCPRPRACYHQCNVEDVLNVHHSSGLSDGYSKSSPKFTDVILLGWGAAFHKIQVPPSLFCSSHRDTVGTEAFENRRKGPNMWNMHAFQIMAPNTMLWGKHRAAAMSLQKGRTTEKVILRI